MAREAAWERMRDSRRGEWVTERGKYSRVGARITERAGPRSGSGRANAGPTEPCRDGRREDCGGDGGE